MKSTAAPASQFTHLLPMYCTEPSLNSNQLVTSISEQLASLSIAAISTKTLESISTFNPEKYDFFGPLRERERTWIHFGKKFSPEVDQTVYISLNKETTEIVIPLDIIGKGAQKIAKAALLILLYPSAKPEVRKVSRLGIPVNKTNEQQLGDEVDLRLKLNNSKGIPKLFLWGSIRKIKADHKAYTKLMIIEELFTSDLSVELYRRQNLQKKPFFTLPDIIQIMISFLEGLKAIHRLKKVHADVKFENILVDFVKSSKGQVICKAALTDLGLCENASTLGKLRGSFSFLPPEIYHKYTKNITSHTYHRKTDMWAVGIVLYILANNIDYAKYPKFLKMQNEQTALHNDIMNLQRNYQLEQDRINKLKPEKDEKQIEIELKAAYQKYGKPLDMKQFQFEEMLRDWPSELLFFLENENKSNDKELNQLIQALLNIRLTERLSARKALKVLKNYAKKTGIDISD